MIDGENLRRIRREYLDVDDAEEKRRRTASLLENIGISSMNFIYKLERGEGNPKIETVFKLADALKCEPWELINDELMSSLMPDSEWDKIVYTNLRKYVGEENKTKIPKRYRELATNEELVKDLGGQLKRIYIRRTAGEGPEGCPGKPRGFPQTEYVELPYNNCEALEVVDDSLEPYLRQGNILVVSHEYRSWKDGDLCEVSVYGNRYIRKVFYDTDGNYYTFQPLSSRFPVVMAVADDVEWIYKIETILS